MITQLMNHTYIFSYELISIYYNTILVQPSSDFPGQYTTFLMKRKTVKSRIKYSFQLIQSTNSKSYINLSNLTLPDDHAFTVTLDYISNNYHSVNTLITKTRFQRI